MTSRWIMGVLRSGGPRAAREVMKVGGSVLALPDWPDHLAEIVRERSSLGPTLIVVGGGPIVDGLRAIDASARRPAEVTHALAIELMGTTARLVADALGLPMVIAWDGSATAVLDPPGWLAVDDRLARLPVGWHTTSDSIAALVAVTVGGDLLLVKRAAPAPCPGGDWITALADAGWVDGHFPVAARDVTRIAWAVPTSVPTPAVGGTATDRSGSHLR